MASNTNNTFTDTISYAAQRDRLRNTSYVRTGAIRVMLPGHGDPDIRLDRNLAIDGIVQQLFEQIPALDGAELLAFPGTTQHEHVLVGYTDDRNHATAVEKALGAAGKPVTSYGEDTDATPTTNGKAPSRIAERMKKIVDKETPSHVGIQVSQIDLSPLGTLPRPTSRLLLPENMELTRINNLSESAIVEIISTLSARGIPHLFATLFTPGSDKADHDFLGAARLVTFGTGNGIVTNDDVATYSQTIDDDLRIASYFDGRCTDNFALPVDAHLRYANNDTRHPTAVEEMDDLSARQSTIHDLKSGFPEYRSLLGGRINADQRYRELFDCYGVLRLRSCDLLHFCAIVPEYYDESLWGRSETADRIRFTVSDTGSSAEGTRQQYGTEQPGDTTRTVDTSNEESDEHQETLIQWLRNLIRQGHEILAVDQSVVDIDFDGTDPTEAVFFDDESRPDIVSRFDGQIYCHEIEIANDSKPAQLLTNLARGAYHGYPVIVVTASKASAQSKFLDDTNADRVGPVREPYKDVDAEGVICYNQDTTITPTADTTILLPRGVTESRWRRTPDDTHQFVADGTVVAEGPADTSVDTYTYNTPRLREQGAGFVLESSTGDIIREQPSESAARGDLVKARKPFPITQFGFLQNTTVKYLSGDSFTEFEFQPDWALAYQDANARRYEEAVKEFLELVTVASEGAEIPLTELRQRFLTWYSALTDLSQPNKTWFGRAVQANYEVDDSDTRNKRLVGRTFRFSEGMLSPDLPFLDAADVDDGD